MPLIPISYCANGGLESGARSPNGIRPMVDSVAKRLAAFEFASTTILAAERNDTQSVAQPPTSNNNDKFQDSRQIWDTLQQNYFTNHLGLFSPTDPDLCMFCHEGNWASVDRIWLINPSKSTPDTNGTVKSNARIAYHRTEEREMAGHEFWAPDGQSLWFQQSYRAHPERGSFLTSMQVADGKLTQYRIPAGFGGIHETFSPDGTFLVADGSGKGETGPNKYLSKLVCFLSGKE